MLRSNGCPLLQKSMRSDVMGAFPETPMTQRSVVLVFRGFDVDPGAVEAMVGVPADSKANKGEGTRSSSGSVYSRSFVRYEVPLEEGTLLHDVIPRLLEHLGGVEKIADVRRSINAEFLDVSILWPARFSEAQEGGSILHASLCDLVALDCDLSMGFF